MVCKNLFATVTAPDCCFGRGSFSSRLGKKGIMSSCETAGDSADWVGGGWLRRNGRSQCPARDVGLTSRKNSLSGDSDDFIVTRIMIWTSNFDNLIIDASLSSLFRYATNQAPETYGS